MKSMIPFGTSPTLFSADVDRLFDGFLGRSLPLAGAFNGTAGPRVHLDLSESDEAYTVVAEIPGVQREDLEITYVGDVLTLAGEKKLETEREGHKERVFGRFERRVRLPLPVDTQAIEAESKDGVLTITLPKAEPARPRKIEIKG